MGWHLRLAGWAYEANGPNGGGLKSRIPKWAKEIKPNPTYFKGWVGMTLRVKPILTTLIIANPITKR